MIIRPNLKKYLFPHTQPSLENVATGNIFTWSKKSVAQPGQKKKSPSLPTLGEMEGQVQEKNIFLKVA